MSVGELRVVEASYGGCPDRTLWVLGDDGLWHCHCCGTARPYGQLTDPVPVKQRRKRWWRRVGDTVT